MDLDRVRREMDLADNNAIRLTDKQKAFADYYLYSGDTAESVRQAGYSKSQSGSELLKNPNIKLYLKLQQESMEKDSIADTEEVLEFLTRAMRGEIFEPIKVGMGKGEEQVQYLPPKVTDRIRAGELLGRRYSAFDSDINVTLQAPTFTGMDEIPE